MPEVGWAYLDFREERGKEGVSGCLYGCWKIGEECDLKAVHAGLKPSTFERT
jgi:hypothetical protein